jgi:hypothetical protein
MLEAALSRNPIVQHLAPGSAVLRINGFRSP